MKIVLSTENHFPGYGGPYTAISQTAYYLYLNGIDFRCIYEKSNIENYRLDYKEIFADIDVIHFFGIWTPWSVRTFYNAKKLNKKIIISPLGATEPWAMSQKKFKKKIAWHLYQKQILQKADYLHATSQLEKLHLRELGIKTPIVVIPHGIEVIEIKKKLNKIKKAVFFSRIHEKKGLLELINSWKIIDNKNWVLDIYGPTSNDVYLTKVKNLISELHLDDVIKIYDPVYDIDKKVEVMSSSDCFVLPSKSENFGLSIGEALSYSIPVLTTTATPWLDIEKTNSGIIFEFSQNNLTKSLKKMLDKNDQELLKMGENGKELIKNNYNFNNLIRDYINFYKKVYTL